MRSSTAEAIRAQLRAAGVLVERSELDLLQEQEARLAAGARIFAIDDAGRREAERIVVSIFGETRARSLLAPRLVADSAPRLR